MPTLSPAGELRLLRVGAHIPAAIWWPIGQLASLVLAARPPRPLRQWQLNAQLASGRVQGFADRRAAQFSWLRNNVLSLQLGTWTPKKIVRRIDIDQNRLAELQSLHAERGLVLALPHMGSWDLAGAYACQVGLPVVSVAERLPAGQFEYFSELRTRLGFEIYPYDQPNLVARLSADVRRGRTVCLVADRDFGRRGLPVRWPTLNGARELTLPAGPVVIAQTTGAALVGIGTTFRRGRMHITIGDEIIAHPGRAGAEIMAQQLANFFAAQISSKPTDWHMMQKFFPGEVA